MCSSDLLLDALAQFLEIIRVGREHAAEDDGLDFLEPRQRRRGGLFRVGHRVADARLRDVLDLRGDEADLARADLGPFLALRRDRKSVVSGKSVSVRVDLGGRRSIKKKK